MKLFIATDFRTVVCEGRLFLASQYYFIIRRYKEQFGEVILCSRIIEDDNIDGLYDVTEMLTGFIGAKNLYEPFKYHFQKKMYNEILKCDLVVGRYHSFAAIIAARLAKKAKKLLYAEVMGDVWDSFWNHSLKGKLIALPMYLDTKRCIKKSNYALYVTKEWLQRRYPCAGKHIGVSDVKIEEVNNVLFEKRMEYYSNKDYTTIKLMTTADVDVAFKGQEYVIRAIPEINKAGIAVHYLMVGGGDSTYLRRIAKELGVLTQVEFKGKVTLPQVFECLDTTDIYIQPSLQEGLPRSVVEAMSRGCVCVGARTGGIPELLLDDTVVDRKSSKSIAETIIRMANAQKMIIHSKYSFEKAKEFLDEKLSADRNGFYEAVKRDIMESGLK